MTQKVISTKDNLQVLFEDNHIIIVNKRAGDIVQGDKTGDTPLSTVVKDYIALKYNKPGKVFLGVVHRLDRPTTGIVVFARTSKALTRLNKLFADKRVDKTYWAIVKNKPKSIQGSITNWLKKNPKNNKSTVYTMAVKGSKEATLHYSVMKTLDRYFVLEIHLETGRHHQIRAQLAYMGCPIKGDLKYGYQRSNDDASICLHSRTISFVHPVSQTIVTCTAPTPKTSTLWDACLD